MILKTFTLVLCLMLAGCSTIPMTTGKHVRVMPLAKAHNCDFISGVEAHHHNGRSDGENMASVISSMKNQAAALGGDTLVVEWSNAFLGASGHGQVYNCHYVMPTAAIR